MTDIPESPTIHLNETKPALMAKESKMQTIHLCYKQDRIAAVYVSDDPYYAPGTNMNMVYDDIRTIDDHWEQLRNYIADEGYNLHHVSDGYDSKQQCSFSVIKPE